MRLIDLILRTWHFRQTMQHAYEKGLPQTQINTDYLESLGDSKIRDRLVEKPDALANFDLTRDDLDTPAPQPHRVDPRDIDHSKMYAHVDGQPVIVQQGAQIPGGRRHAGIAIWLWLVDRLKRLGIVLEMDEYGALDEGYVECVADLAAEMHLERLENPNATVPLVEAWVKEIESRVDNEPMAEEIMAEMFRMFGFQAQIVEEPVRNLGYEPATSDLVIPAEVLNPMREKATHGER